MKENARFRGDFLNRLSPIVLYISLIVCSGSCHLKYTLDKAPSHPPFSEYPHQAKWLDWNVLFQPGANNASRLQYMNYLQQYITDYINQYNATNSPRFVVSQTYIYCPCDSLLYNFSVTPLFASGQAPNPPIPPGRGQGGSGDAVQYTNLNNSVTIDSITQLMKPIDTTGIINLGSFSMDTSKTLAIMDTGLDSTLYADHFKGLLWKAPGGNTIRNFLWFNNGQYLDYYADDDQFKHGSAVTTIALQALEKSFDKRPVMPRVMVLKVLDNNRIGSTFTVSCALSYAVQNQATLVNASLGYYSSGDVDSVLRHYVGLCHTAGPKSIPLLAAAGNLPGVHNPPLCGNTDKQNELTPSRLFFPGCFTTSFPNVISVTGLQNPQLSCFYQNYSNTYVSVGVENIPASGPNCCAFQLPFLLSGYEGSSFATPVVSGKIMGCLLETLPGTVPPDCLDKISKTPPQPSPKDVTIDGRYIIYKTP